MPEPPFSAELISKLRSGAPILALTGAGISAESGLATFRGPGGLWEGRDPLELATPEAFRADPLTSWRFYAWRREQAAAAEPNAAHRALAELARGRDGFTLVTQNVDGLHERAGSPDVIRLHGSLWRLRCVDDGREFDDRRLDLPLPPRCPCGGLLRPAVVWFGEPLPADALLRAHAAAERAAVALVVGTSSLVYPAAALPSIARNAGAFVVEINPEPALPAHVVDERLAGQAGEVLPRLLRSAGITRPAREAGEETH